MWWSEDNLNQFPPVLYVLWRAQVLSKSAFTHRVISLAPKVGRWVGIYCMSVSVCHDACLEVRGQLGVVRSLLCCVFKIELKSLHWGHKYLYQLSYLLGPRFLNLFIIYTNCLVLNTCGPYVQHCRCCKVLLCRLFLHLRMKYSV